MLPKEFRKTPMSSNNTQVDSEQSSPSYSSMAAFLFFTLLIAAGLTVAVIVIKDKLRERGTSPVAGAAEKPTTTAAAGKSKSNDDDGDGSAGLYVTIALASLIGVIVVVLTIRAIKDRIPGREWLDIVRKAEERKQEGKDAVEEVQADLEKELGKEGGDPDKDRREPGKESDEEDDDNIL
jgi:hypothetical protein